MRVVPLLGRLVISPCLAVVRLRANRSVSGMSWIIVVVDGRTSVSQLSARMAQLAVEPDGIVFGPTALSGRTYKSMNYHRQPGLRPDKTKWNPEISRREEYAFFEQSEARGWLSPAGDYWWVATNARMAVGLTGERIAFFPICHNLPGPWHGYPVSPNTDRDYEVPSELIDRWEEHGGHRWHHSQADAEGKHMRIKRLQLAGHFVEAYLYFDYAWLFSKDGVVRAFDLSKYCEDRLNGEGGAAMAVFSDNRRLKAQQGVSESEPTALTRLLASDTPIQVPVQDVDRYSHIFQTAGTCRSILDIRFYNGRAFVGTDDGISQFIALGREDLREHPLGRSNTGLSDQKVSDWPARQIQGRYGAVTAACGPDGGIVGVGVGVERRDRRVVFEQFAERSYAVEMNGNAVSSLATSTRWNSMPWTAGKTGGVRRRPVPTRLPIARPWWASPGGGSRPSTRS